MALLVQASSMLIRGVSTPLGAKKKNNFYQFKTVWLSSVLFHVPWYQSPAVAAPPVLAYSCSFGGCLGRGRGAGSRGWDPRACSAPEGFCPQQLPQGFSPESRVDTKGNKCLSVPVRGWWMLMAPGLGGSASGGCLSAADLLEGQEDLPLCASS